MDKIKEHTHFKLVFRILGFVQFMYRRVGKALAEPDLPPRQGPIAAIGWKKNKERVEWVGGVRYDGLCFTCSVV